MRPILVTGAQGFVGRYLIAHWLATDPEATVVGIGRSAPLDRRFTHTLHWGAHPVGAPMPPPLTQTLSTNRYRYISCDVSDVARLTRLLTDIRPEFIVHLAASLRGDPPARLVHANIGTVAGLFEAVGAAKLHPVRIVLGSSGAVYGHIPGRLPPLREDAVCAPIDPYAVTKWAAEQLGRTLSEHYGVRAVAARIFNPIGPAQHERHLCASLVRQAAAIASSLQPPVISVGRLDTTRDFVDVRDAATALRVIAMRGEAGGAYNVASGQETSGQKILDVLLDQAELSGRIALDRRPARIADIHRHYADVARVLALGYSPQYSLTDSLRHMFDYYRHSVALAAVSDAS
jgi:nucleoside-diphosphate-sugar epimerase